MNLDEMFGLDESMVLVQTNPIILLSEILLVIVIAWICARRYRDTYDIEKSIKLYIPISIVVALIYIICGISAIFSLGTILFGLAALVIISNHYFKN